MVVRIATSRASKLGWGRVKTPYAQADGDTHSAAYTRTRTATVVGRVQIRSMRSLRVGLGEAQRIQSAARSPSRFARFRPSKQKLLVALVTVGLLGLLLPGPQTVFWSVFFYVHLDAKRFRECLRCFRALKEVVVSVLRLLIWRFTAFDGVLGRTAAVTLTCSKHRTVRLKCSASA